MTELAIVIVSYRAKADLERCLDSLRQAPPSTPHQIVVVDNASGDGTPDAIRSARPEVQLVEAGGNLGFSAANNLGVRRTESRLLLFLNPDTIVPAGAVDRLVTGLAADEAVGIVGPRLVDGAGRAELSFGRMIGPVAELRQKILMRAYDAGVPVLAGRVAQMTRRARDVDWVSGACLMVRREDAVRAGLFDERFSLYCEDVDFCAAVRALGKRVRFEPGVEVVHLRGRSRATEPAAAAAAYRRSQVAFYEKHHPKWVRALKWYMRLKEGA